MTLTGVGVQGNVATTASNPYPSALSGGCATGGGIFSTNSGSLTILSGTDVYGNSASGGLDSGGTAHGTGSASGGGIFVYSGSAVIDLSLVRNNFVQCNYAGCSVGAGIVNLDTLTVQNRTSITANYSAGTLWGGGIYTSTAGSTTILAPVTISNNSATDGGGLYVYSGGTVTFKSTKSNKVTYTDITLSGNQPDQCGPASQGGTYSYSQGARTTNGTTVFTCPSP